MFNASVLRRITFNQKVPQTHSTFMSLIARRLLHWRTTSPSVSQSKSCLAKKKCVLQKAKGKSSFFLWRTPSNEENLFFGVAKAQTCHMFFGWSWRPCLDDVRYPSGPIKINLETLSLAFKKLLQRPTFCELFKRNSWSGVPKCLFSLRPLILLMI